MSTFMSLSTTKPSTFRRHGGRGKLFLAGASGAIGQRLIPLLLADGWSVMGMTRFPERATAMQRLGIETVVADAFDTAGVMAAVSKFLPDVLIHQLTDLPRDLAELNEEALERNARLRWTGTRNLVAAAHEFGIARVVAQSIAFDYAPGPLPHREDDLLAGRLDNASSSSKGVIGLEDQVVGLKIPFVILRYGRLYGPGTGSDRPWGAAPVHVDAAAYAAALAARTDAKGVFNIAERDGEVDTTLAETKLGWTPGFRGWQGPAVPQLQLSFRES